MKKRIFWICLFFCFESFIACAKPTEPDGTVTLYLGWTPQFQFAGYIAAKELGYYEDAGIKVKLVTIDSAIVDDVSEVAKGTYQYGVATSAMLLANPDVYDVVTLAAIFQQSPVSLITLKSSGIRTLSDLRNKRVAIGNELKAMIVSAGVPLNSLQIDGKGTAFSNLLNHQYDAISYYITDKEFLLGNDSLNYRIFRPIEYGISFYGECLYTSKAELDTHPDRVEKMLKATMRGWHYAIDHPDSVVQMIIDRYQPGIAYSALMDEASTTINSLIIPSLFDLGDMQLSKWQATNDALYRLGVIKNEVDLGSFLYNRRSVEEGRLLKRMMTIVGIATGIVGVVLLLLLFYNRSLKKAVELRTKKLEEANLEMDQFVYSVSHDIRSPLSSIQGMVNLMRMDEGQVEQGLVLIEQSVRRLDGFTKDILDYSKNARADVHPENVNIKNLIDEITSEVQFSESNLAMQFIVEVEENLSIFIDRWRLTVILRNIISNAVKYRDREKTDSFVRISTEQKPGQIVLIIRDNGIGIGEQHLEHLFDMFYRANSSSNGSGLGLHIVKETVHSIDGHVQVESEEDVGTSLTVTLPSHTVA